MIFQFFIFSHSQRLNISFESCHQKALRQWIHQREAKRHLQLLVIKPYPKATKPISLSKILQHPHKPHTPSPIFPIYTQHPEELGGGKNKAGLLSDLAELWKRSQKSQGQMQGKGCALQGTLMCCSNPGVLPEPSIHEPSRAGSRGWEQEDPPEQPTALPGCCLHFPAD